MAHLYRGEMHRMVTWRARLDTTSYWAILLTSGMSTFALGAQSLPHYILLLGLALNTMVILMEARRFRQLHHTRWRVRMLERHYFASLLRAECESSSWRTRLAADLEQPHTTLSLLTALRMRLRRNYVMFFYFVTAVWLTKLFIHPTNAGSLAELHGRMAVGGLFPSWFVAVTAGAFLATITALALSTPSEELLDQRAAADGDATNDDDDGR